MYISGEGLTSVLQGHGDNLIGVEIGVCRGETSKYWLDNCANISWLIGVDPWKEYPEMTQEQLDGFFRCAQDNLKDHIKSGRSLLQRMFSEQAAKYVPDGSLDFIFVDGNHTYPAVLLDMRTWYPKVKTGGIITGHDWGKRGVVDAVNKFREEMGITEPIHRAKNSAWYFYKPGV
jgi:hypothetical protein